MGSLSFKTSENKPVAMDGVKTAVLQKREDSSEIECSRIRSFPDNDPSSKWQSIKIRCRKDGSSTMQIQSSSIAPNEVCGTFPKYIDFSLESGQNQKHGSHAVLADKHVSESDSLLSSEKQPVAVASLEFAEHNPRAEKGNDIIKEEPSILQSDSGTSRHRDEKCIYSKIFISKRRSVTKEEKDRAFQAARAFTSSNPYFTVVMRPTHVYRAFYMSIPSSFVRTHLSGRTRDMALKTSGPRQWPVHCTFRKDYAGLRKGWSTFVWENNLEEGDACVFERVDGSVFTFRVHIFRVIDEIMPLSRSYMPYIPKVPRTNGRKRVQQFLDHARITEGRMPEVPDIKPPVSLDI